jgi:opacity protein-like surface antigen
MLLSWRCYSSRLQAGDHLGLADLERVGPREVLVGPQSPARDALVRSQRGVGRFDRGIEPLADDRRFAIADGAGSWSDTRIGYTVGGGVEAAISYGWKARVEYRYTDLGDYSVNIPLANNYGGACSSLCGTNARIDLGPTNQRITFGIGFDF